MAMGWWNGLRMEAVHVRKAHARNKQECHGSVIFKLRVKKGAPLLGRCHVSLCAYLVDGLGALVSMHVATEDKVHAVPSVDATHPKIK